MSKVELKSCPFCGGRGELKIFHYPSPNGYAKSHDNAVVECQQCAGRSAPYMISHLADRIEYTVQDFRSNLALRAKVEDEYDEYCESIKSLAVNAWNTRAISE